MIDMMPLPNSKSRRRVLIVKKETSVARKKSDQRNSGSTASKNSIFQNASKYETTNSVLNPTKQFIIP